MRPILSSPLFWLASGVALALAPALAIGCSSSSSGGGTTGPQPDSGGTTDTGSTADAGGGTDSNTGDGAHDGPSPDALYSACAVNAGFGWPCSAAATGPDAVNCTNPAFPVCFVGGQGAWCTKTCVTVTDCTTDAGCTPTACNGRGYCK